MRVGDRGEDSRRSPEALPRRRSVNSAGNTNCAILNPSVWIECADITCSRGPNRNPPAVWQENTFLRLILTLRNSRASSSRCGVQFTRTCPVRYLTQRAFVHQPRPTPNTRARLSSWRTTSVAHGDIPVFGRSRPLSHETLESALAFADTPRCAGVSTVDTVDSTIL